ncbi:MULTISPECIES: FHA domain-containing protein [unclassified Nocardioides]|uniref:FHA domain-containing protein n=1 Tax=unclassified Nocardioides TaxID=2615069 RepID=UPI0006FF11B5|nr:MULTISPECIES: FHA domain-containing protein [unclassified Nocardioides]KQY56784.1 hypothetical protein ASD30_10765 [Nocardioides sp. Root140]KRF12904.1 hypothetical protein ASH02_15415 [Nocardioides sp. Soil796]
MPTRLKIAADLGFTIERPGGRTVHGRLHGEGSRLRLEVDHPEAFATRADAVGLASLAAGLAKRGLVIDVTRGSRILLSLGAVRVPWWHRRLTGSRHIRIGSVRGLVAPGRARLAAGDGEGVLPVRDLVPPRTLLPIAPTFMRPPRRRVTITHDPAKGGQPRLVLVSNDDRAPLGRRRNHRLRGPLTSIGGSDECDIRLDGLHALHAEVLHDDEDEFVVVAHADDVRVNGARVQRQRLRTGSRLQVGAWTLVFTREEYADHGRPYGGRIGGELGHQRPQPPRHVLNRGPDD